MEKLCLGGFFDRPVLRNEDMSRKSLANGQDEFGRDSRLYNVAESPGGEAPAYKVGIGVNRQKDDPRNASGVSQSIHCFDAIKNRHGNIGDDDIRLQSERFVKQGLAVANLADDFKFRTQETLRKLGETWVVVRQ